MDEDAELAHRSRPVQNLDVDPEGPSLEIDLNTVENDYPGLTAQEVELRHKVEAMADDFEADLAAKRQEQADEATTTIVLEDEPNEPISAPRHVPIKANLIKRQTVAKRRKVREHELIAGGMSAYSAASQSQKEITS